MKSVNLKSRKTFNGLNNWTNKLYFVHKSGNITTGEYIGIAPHPKSTFDLLLFRRTIDCFESFFRINIDDWKKNVIKRNGVYITPSKTTALEYSEKIRNKI